MREFYAETADFGRPAGVPESYCQSRHHQHKILLLCTRHSPHPLFVRGQLGEEFRHGVHLALILQIGTDRVVERLEVCGRRRRRHRRAGHLGPGGRRSGVRPGDRHGYFRNVRPSVGVHKPCNHLVPRRRSVHFSGLKNMAPQPRKIERKTISCSPSVPHSPSSKSPGERTKASSRALVLHSMLERAGPTYFHSRPVEAALSSGRGCPFSDMTSHTESHTRPRPERGHSHQHSPALYDLC